MRTYRRTLVALAASGLALVLFLAIPGLDVALGIVRQGDGAATATPFSLTALGSDLLALNDWLKMHQVLVQPALIAIVAVLVVWPILLIVAAATRRGPSWLVRGVRLPHADRIPWDDEWRFGK